jgi:uncharacterized protein (DUF983 family)
MINKGTKLYSILHQKCPHCQEGDMFKYSTFSTHFMQMHERCPVCGFDFIQEPSFYFGAMYFSYAIQVAVFVAVYFLLRYTADPGTWTYVLWMIIASIIILPLNFRWSRVAWINLFTKYRGASKNSGATL